MMLFLGLLLVSVIGSKCDWEGAHRQITKGTRDGGISSVDYMTEHQYLGNSGFLEVYTFDVIDTF